MEGLTTIGFTAHGAPEVVDAHPGSLKRSTTTTLSKITDDENSPQPSHGMKDVVPPVPLPVNGCDSRVSLRLRKSRGKTFGNQKCDCNECPAVQDLTEPDGSEQADLTALPLEMEDMGDELLVSEQVKTIKVTFDTGAGAHVASPEDLTGFQIEESAASRAGRGFIAANRERIANQGQVQLKVRERDFGNALKTVFQVAEVSRPLMAGSAICDEGNEVLMNSREAIVRREDTKKVVAKFKREGGLYVAEMDVISDGSPAPFTRQGAKR